MLFHAGLKQFVNWPNKCPTFKIQNGCQIIIIGAELLFLMIS